MWLTIAVVVGTLAFVFGGDVLADVPSDDRFIYPLRRVTGAVGELAFIPTAAVLIVGMITVWPLLIQWGIAQGDAVPDLEPPNVALLVLVILVSAVAFNLFQRVDPPERLQTLNTADHVYVFSVRENTLQEPEFFLYQCDSREIICRSLLAPGDTSPAWNTRMVLQIEDDTLRLMNGQTAVFTYTLPQG